MSLISFRTRRVVKKWRLPGGGSPDMGGVSANGRVLWLTGRYNGVIYAISTRTGSPSACVSSSNSQSASSTSGGPMPSRVSCATTGPIAGRRLSRWPA